MTYGWRRGLSHWKRTDDRGRWQRRQFVSVLKCSTKTQSLRHVYFLARPLLIKRSKPSPSFSRNKLRFGFPFIVGRRLRPHFIFWVHKTTRAILHSVRFFQFLFIPNKYRWKHSPGTSTRLADLFANNLSDASHVCQVIPIQNSEYKTVRLRTVTTVSGVFPGEFYVEKLEGKKAVYLCTQMIRLKSSYYTVFIDCYRPNHRDDNRVDTPHTWCRTIVIILFWPRLESERPPVLRAHYTRILCVKTRSLSFLDTPIRLQN